MLFRTFLISLLGFFLGACQAPQGKPSDSSVGGPRGSSKGSEIRSAAQQESGVIEVAPLRDPVAAELERQANQFEQAGDLAGARRALEQALQVVPEDPEILQRLAELALEQGQFDQAIQWAERSYQLGPKIGNLCARSLRTVDEARRGQGEQIARIDYQVCQVQERKTF